jgi:ribosomal-protein-alanine N-acetyltransferase
MRWWDVDELLPIERDLFGASAWTAETFWAELAHPESRWYVVAQDDAGALLGYAGLLWSGPEADVQTIAVAATAQGKGLGGLLLDALIERAHAKGSTAMLLEVRADNRPAIVLYENRGFERIAIRRRYYQPEDVDAWVMRLRPLRTRAEQPILEG